MYDDLVKNTINDINTFLKDSLEHKNKEICYVLVDNKTKETNTLAYGNDEAIEFTPYTKSNENGYGYVEEWDYNFDYYILYLLENDYDIGYMNINVHYDIWNNIGELYPTDINYEEGMQKYLKYCKDNGITKEYIEENTKLKVKDIMKYYNETNCEKKIILDSGCRGNIPIALIRWNRNSSYEYVIAINYRKKNNELEWGYGYYYGDDIKKAKKEFYKVLEGKSLVNTFKIKDKER